MSKRIVSTKRESFIEIDGKNTRLADDVHEWLSEFCNARGYKPLVRGIEYVVRTVKDSIPMNENVTLESVENRGAEVRN